jgi:RNA-directed DNA polymerase
MLANLRMFGLDGDLSEIASHHGLIYTRYSDDLCFSTADRSFDRNKAKAFIAQIYKILSASGFIANQAKTVISPPGSRKIILGLLVDGDRLHLPREYKDSIRQHLFYLSKSRTASEHAQRRHFRSVSGMLAHVRGLIDYARQIEPELGNAMLAEYSKILSEKSYIPGDFD